MARTNPHKKVVLSPDANRDIQEILLWSRRKFGAEAAVRYRQLLIQALRDLEEDPLRVGSTPRQELSEAARLYHIGSSRYRVQTGRVKAPRHFIVYRIRTSHLEIGRILHDSRDIARHLPGEWLT